MLRLRFGTSSPSQFWIQYLSFHLSPWCVRICSLNKQNWEGGREKEDALLIPDWTQEGAALK